MENGLEARIQRAIREKLFPGCAIGIVRKNGQRIILARGQLSYEPGAVAVTPDTLYDVASITKVIPTSSLALMLIDQGRLGLTDKLIDYVPEFRNGQAGKVQIKHLLTYTLDFDFTKGLSMLGHRTPSEMLDYIFTLEFKSPPGTTFAYVNPTAILLGLVVTKIFGQPIDKLGDKYFFKPLAMDHTTFKPLQEFHLSQIAPTEILPDRGVVQGIVHDKSAYVLSKSQTPSHAGLFSTVPDLLNFLEILLNGGCLGNTTYFSPAIIEQIQTNQLASIGQSAGLGWELNQPAWMGKHASPKTFGKTGFTGCRVVCDIDRGVALATLSNATYPVGKPDRTLNDQFRSDIANIIFENL